MALNEFDILEEMSDASKASIARAAIVSQYSSDFDERKGSTSDSGQANSLLRDRSSAAAGNHSDSLTDENRSSQSQRVARSSANAAQAASSASSADASSSGTSSSYLTDDDSARQTPVWFADAHDPYCKDKPLYSWQHFCVDVPPTSATNPEALETLTFAHGDPVFYYDTVGDKTFSGVVRWLGFLTACSQVDGRTLLAGVELVFETYINHMKSLISF